MREFEIEINRLSSDASELETACGSVSASAQESYEIMKSLKTEWEGSAQQVFENQIDADFEMIKGMEETIKYMVECLKYAAKEYSKCENEVYNEVNS